MSEQKSLRPVDVVVALRLAEAPGATYQNLASSLSISQSTAHEAVERLQGAHLLRPDSRRVNRHALLEFLEHGVRYAFPGALGARTTGVPTAHSAPALADEVVSDGDQDGIVWPDPTGSAFGYALTPLFPKAPALLANCPSTYEALSLVDALRVGRARERALAAEELRRRFYSDSDAVVVIA